MPDVTVLGAGGATVTIALSSAQNATAAQLAMNFVNKTTESGLVDVQTWSGKGTLPAPGNLLGSAIVTTPGNIGGLDPAYFSLAVNAVGNTTAVGPARANATVVSGDGANLTYGAVATNAQVFFGDSNSALINFAGTTNLAVGHGNYVLLTDKGATSNVHGEDALLLTSDIGGNSGTTNISVNGTKTTVIATGASTVPVNINAASGELFFVNDASGSAFIQNTGNANITVVGSATDTGGRATVFGGSSSGMIVAQGQGEFTGGTGGNNLLFTSTVAGSATLVGGGSGDVLFAMGSGNLLVAGAGNEILTARHLDAAPNRYITGNGFTTVFGSGQGGNSYYFSGLGSGLIEGRDETASGTASQNTYIDLDATKGGFHLISDFLTGTDKLQIGASADATIDFFAAGAAGSPFGAAAGTQVTISTGTVYNFFDTGSDGAQDIFQSDITKV